MEQQFNYTAKFSYWVFTPAVIFGGAAVALFASGKGLALRGHRLLDHPTAAYVFGGLALAGLVYAVLKSKAAADINANSAAIVLRESGLEFPNGASDVIAVEYADVNELWVKDTEDDGESVILYSGDGKHRHEFFAENFDSLSRFTAFKSTLEQHCTSITNR